MHKEKNQAAILGRILRELKPFLGHILLSLFCALITVILTLEIPVLTGQAVDCILGPGRVDFPGLFAVLRRMAVVVAATFFSQWIMNRLNNYITYRVTCNMRQQAFAKMIRLPLRDIDGHSHGDYMSRIVTDADVFSDGLLMGFTQLFTGVLTIVGTIGFMLNISVPIALVVILLTPVSLLMAKFIATRTYAMFQLQAKRRGEQTSLVEEMIEHKKVVRLFNYEREAQKAFDAGNELLADSSMKATFYSSITNPATRFVNSLIYAGVGVSGAMLAVYGGISVGALTSFLGYANQYAKPFNEISGVVTELQNALACAARLFEMADMPLEEEQVKTTLEKPEGRVKFENVAFSYDPERPLIRNLNLTVEPGQRVAIVGPTGSGKTTLINLLMRFYEVDEGRITIDGVDIRDISKDNLRSSFGMVLQETWLKEGTVMENLRMANPDASQEEVVAAAKAAHAHEFIRRLPKKYDTVLGEDGGSLSQGQKQLLCIARVMLHLPPMLILDEATSSIDTRTEMKIQEAFGRMMVGRTTFVVAHRLSTIRESDLILYMQDGQVLEQGTHESLLAKNGYYAKLYYSQFREN